MSDDRRTISIGPVDLTPANFLTADDDRTINRVSVLSRPAEHHALWLGVGFGATFVALLVLSVQVPGLLLAVAAAPVLARAFQHVRGSGHWRDFLSELAYGFAGAAIGFLGTALFVASFIAYLGGA